MRPPAFNGLVERVGDALTVRHTVVFLIDGMQYCFVFGHADALGELVALAGIILVESEFYWLFAFWGVGGGVGMGSGPAR